MTGTTYASIDECHHFDLNDVRGGCSGCNYAVDDIIGRQDARLAKLEADNVRLLAALHHAVAREHPGTPGCDGCQEMSVVIVEHAERSIEEAKR